MIKNICNSELFVPQKSKTTKLVLAILVGAALLPLSAIATPMDDKEVDQLSKETIIDESKEKVTTITNSSEKKDSGKSDNDTFDSSMPANAKGATVDQPIDVNAANDGISSNNNAADASSKTGNKDAAVTTAPLEAAEARASDNTEEKAVEPQPKIDKKTSFWQNTDYLLIGGLALLLLGGGLLLFRKISGLNAENRNLNQKNNMLTSNLTSTKKQLEQASSKNVELEADFKQQLAIHNEHNNSASGAFGAALPVIDEIMVEPEIEDLNSADLEQLSDSITTWFKTNRGNTEVRELVPNDIQKKLDHLSYKIELWVGSDGVDSVELASDTKRAAVISLTKPDRQGFAYCYKKPNSLSNVWDNKAWYKAQRTERTLEVIGKLLESN